MTTAVPDLRAIVQSYHRKGWAPIPIPLRSKNPGRNGWQNERLTETDIDAKFSGHPQNIGVLLGEPSGWLIDIDLDHPLAVELAPKFLPPTPAVFGRKSNRKSHYLYITGMETKKFKSPVYGMLVEIRSTGLQTVFPPSVHPSGEPILWEPEAGNPAEVNANTLQGAAAKLAEEVGRQLEAPKVDGCYAAMMKMNMQDAGDGSARLHACCCRAVEHDLSDQQVIDAIRAYAKKKPFPTTWTDDQILERVRQAENKTTRGKVKPAKSSKKKVEPPIVKEMADAICTNNHFSQDVGGKLYRFVGGVYKRQAENYVKASVKKLAIEWGKESKWSSKLATEVVEYIRVDAPELWERPRMNVLNVKNGLLVVADRKLIEHDPAYLSTVQLPVDYDPDAKCPLAEDFVSQTFPSDAHDLAWELPAWLT